MDLLRALTSASADDRAAWNRLVGRVGPATVATWLSPPALAAAMLADTDFATQTLEALRMPEAPVAALVAAAFPDVVALAAPAPAQVEHDPPADGKPSRPLLDHVATRLLGRKLLGLEKGERARFQDRGLTQAGFDQLVAIARRVLGAGLGPALRAAIFHLDIAKTTSESHRATWTGAGIALEVHNEAAAAILRKLDRARGWPLPPVLGKLAIAWVEAHGLAGQHVRGEGPMMMFAPLVGSLRELATPLGRQLGIDATAATQLALDGLHVLNACDTAAVREGLLDDALMTRLARVRDQLTIVASSAPWTDPYAALSALAPPADRAHLAERLRGLRAQRQATGEPAAAVEVVVAAVGDAELAVLAPALATCQLWYCEAATAGLSPAAQLGVLASAVGTAKRLGIDTARPWHAQLRPLVGALHPGHGDGVTTRYRRRLVEAALASRPIGELLAGAAGTGPLGTLATRLASATADDAIVVEYVDSAESAALVTLLGLYETRSQVQFHSMLKALCDLYGLRKDELDRVNNEASYLASMNAARSDKQRMLDFVKPGRIIEVGPGGGVVLDLLAARFPSAEIFGVDASREVVDALARLPDRRWKVVRGAAEQLDTLVEAADTVVYCSILHEVYSYGGFSLDRVRDVVRAGFSVLRPGGRLVIRDGVMPPQATRRIRFLAPDARPTFDLYAAQFAGRPIEFVELAPDRVELSAADAMEFLYTYTWGPASFPYEVREQYGILPYDDYVARVLDWCGGSARSVDIPAALRSYLQPGYRDHLVGKIELADERDLPADLPDSNCVIVVERI